MAKDSGSEKDEEYEAASKAGGMAGRAVADYYTGGNYESIRNMPVVGDVAKGAENKIGDAVATADKNTGGNIGKVAKKADDAGILDGLDKAGQMYGSAKGGGAGGAGAGGAGAAAGGAGAGQGLGNSAGNALGENQFKDFGAGRSGNSEEGPKIQVSGKNQPPQKKGGSDKKDSGSPTDAGKSDDKKDDNSSGSSDGSGSGEGGKNKKGKIIATILPPILFFVMIVLIIGAVAAIILGPIYAAIEYLKSWGEKFKNFFFPDQQELERRFYEKLKEVQTSYKNADICIDANLITATLTVNKTYDSVVEDGDSDIEENLEEASESGEVTSDINYKKIQKQVSWLSAMQVKYVYYGWDTSLTQYGDKYCKSSGVEEIVPVTSETIDNFKNGSITAKDSSTPNLVSQHDKTGIAAFFSNKVDDEVNYEYVLYRPVVDANGECNATLPESGKKLDIGDFNTRKETVYYWNLVNEFIPYFYDDELPAKSKSEEREKAIYALADDIYSLYQNVGTGQLCNNDTYFVASADSLCPNGITIEGVGTIDFEDYIAGVVSREAYTGEGMEALKAQAVAARTYAINKTNYCERSIGNSTSAQTYTSNVAARAKEAVEATRGEIMLYNGKVFSAMYDSYCFDDGDCPDAAFDGTSYTVTYKKMPGGETHTVVLTDSSQFGRITHGQGHASGMSQLHSYQLAKEGKNYREILAYYYSDGVTINKYTSVATPTTGATVMNESIARILESHGISVDSFNGYIRAQVNSAGFGTRAGAVAAARALSSGLYEMSGGYKIPYELHPSGKFTRYGIDSIWGTATGNSSWPLNGLDCSGFVSWAIHNGGFKYDSRSARGWKESSVSRHWAKGTYDDKAIPGDLIYIPPPAGGNGTTGHIIMIIGVNESGYVTAESSGSKKGVVVQNVSFTSTRDYYLVDMTNYYNSREVESSSSS